MDSRQIIADSILPIVCHVGGSGEAGYYSEIIPAARALKLPFHVFFKYTRIFYNAPWNNVYASNLEAENFQSLMNSELFSSLSRWVESRKRKDLQGIEEAYKSIEKNILSVFEGLNKA